MDKKKINKYTYLYIIILNKNLLWNATLKRCTRIINRNWWILFPVASFSFFSLFLFLSRYHVPGFIVNYRSTTKGEKLKQKKEKKKKKKRKSRRTRKRSKSSGSEENAKRDIFLIHWFFFSVALMLFYTFAEKIWRLKLREAEL